MADLICVWCIQLKIIRPVDSFGNSATQSKHWDELQSAVQTGAMHWSRFRKNELLCFAVVFQFCLVGLIWFASKFSMNCRIVKKDQWKPSLSESKQSVFMLPAPQLIMLRPQADWLCLQSSNWISFGPVILLAIECFNFVGIFIFWTHHFTFIIKKREESVHGPAHLHLLGQTLKKHIRWVGLGWVVPGLRQRQGRALVETAGSDFPNGTSVLSWTRITLC